MQIEIQVDGFKILDGKNRKTKWHLSWADITHVAGVKICEFNGETMGMEFRAKKGGPYFLVTDDVLGFWELVSFVESKYSIDKVWRENAARSEDAYNELLWAKHGI